MTCFFCFFFYAQQLAPPPSMRMSETHAHRDVIKHRHVCVWTFQFAVVVVATIPDAAPCHLRRSSTSGRKPVPKWQNPAAKQSPRPHLINFGWTLQPCSTVQESLLTVLLLVVTGNKKRSCRFRVFGSFKGAKNNTPTTNNNHQASERHCCMLNECSCNWILMMEVAGWEAVIGHGGSYEETWGCVALRKWLS